MRVPLAFRRDASTLQPPQPSASAAPDPSWPPAPAAVRRRGLAVLFLLHIAAGWLLLAPGYIRPDSVGVAAFLRSAVIDRDLLFFNEWESFGLIRNGVIGFKEVTPVHALANHWWIGTSLLTAPAYLIAHALCRLVPALGTGGFFGLYGAVLSWFSVFAGCGVTLAACALLQPRPDERVRTATALAAAWLGTPLAWYVFRFPIGTHAAGALCVGLLCLLLVRDRNDLPDAWHGLACGLAFGMAAACRLQHIVLLPAILFAGRAQRRSLLFAAGVAAGAAAPLLPQAIAWLIVYGTPFGPLVRGADPGSGTWEAGGFAAISSILFSSWHGLLPWSPVVAFAVAGWILAWRTDRIASGTFILMFLAELGVNAFGDRYYWGGMSFGPRRFVDLAVPVAVGIGWFLRRLRSPIASLAVSGATAWTIALSVAATAGTLDLSLDPGFGGLWSAATGAETWSRLSPALLRSPVAAGSLALPSLAALAIFGLLLGACSWLARRPRPAIVAAVALPLAAAIALLPLTGPTRREASAELARLAITPAAWPLGPLLDKRKLLDHELEHARRIGRESLVASLQKEIDVLESRISGIREAMSRSAPAGTDQALPE